MNEKPTFLGRCRQAASWTGEKLSNFPLRFEVHHKRDAGIGGWLVKEMFALGSVAALVAVGVMASGPAAIAAFTGAALIGILDIADDARRITDSFEKKTITRIQDLQARTGLDKGTTLEVVEAAKEANPKTSPIQEATRAIEPLTKPKGRNWVEYVLNKDSQSQGQSQEAGRA